jgi:enoyl-CoA hydratase/carnithine racemase
MSAEEGERWGFFNRVVEADTLESAKRCAGRADRGRADLRQFHDQDDARAGMVDDLEQAIEAEAQAQAICMQTGFRAAPMTPSSTKEKPVFEGD